ncbi:RNA methyltransferase [Treponema sp. OttesenSCG-928-L16]|nr:RNA methyltransferase [Treponema sp. OttesenSCG-928-L16]
MNLQIMLLSDIRIILVRPSESGNIGGVCRAMKNMGLARLGIVAPESPLDEQIIRSRAVHAQDIWEAACHYVSLREAVSGCALVIGTTRRRGQKRKSQTLNPAESAAYLKKHPGPAALVFGNERTGLEGEELALCNLASHISANPDFPSLNLSHAVQIYAYELFKELSGAGGGYWVPLEQEALEKTVGEITGALASIGFYKQPGREEQEQFLMDILSRAGISLKESRYLENIFIKASRLAKKTNTG